MHTRSYTHTHARSCSHMHTHSSIWLHHSFCKWFQFCNFFAVNLQNRNKYGKANSFDQFSVFPGSLAEISRASLFFFEKNSPLTTFLAHKRRLFKKVHRDFIFMISHEWGKTAKNRRSWMFAWSNWLAWCTFEGYKVGALLGATAKRISPILHVKVRIWTKLRRASFIRESPNLERWSIWVNPTPLDMWIPRRLTPISSPDTTPCIRMSVCPITVSPTSQNCQKTSWLHISDGVRYKSQSEL